MAPLNLALSLATVVRFSTQGSVLRENSRTPSLTGSFTEWNNGKTNTNILKDSTHKAKKTDLAPLDLTLDNMKENSKQISFMALARIQIQTDSPTQVNLSIIRSRELESSLKMVLSMEFGLVLE